ncbi:Hypothetical predicted protein [Olea europaea subsp. europaea]|uniref:Uncharacterized protein n=1 Tax=Olea europaea subsp. europaea TaxID=158383 RepID=A0A8S0Q9C6_OLEEU|nr:Hypothetical predicted protein [Olea europaea subsp. europaea]
MSKFNKLPMPSLSANPQSAASLAGHRLDDEELSIELHSSNNSQLERQVSLCENTKAMRYSTQANVLFMLFIFVIAGAFATISSHPNIGPAETNLMGIKRLMEVPEGFYFILIVTTICLVSITMVIIVTWSQLVRGSRTFYPKSLVFFVMALTFIIYALQVQQITPHFFIRIRGDYKISSF